MSTHAVEVVPVKLEPHPNADTLSIVRVRGFQVVVKTESWIGADRAAYIEPDSLVPETEPFLFLKDAKRSNWRRITVRKFRGVVSQGLLVAAPQGAAIGDDVAEALGVTHYEPPVPFDTGGESEQGPGGGFRPAYDVESFNRYPSILVPGEEVVITEKLHGASARYTHQGGPGGRFHCGSRGEWKRETETNVWWRALRATPALGPFLEAREDLTAYGEVYGQVQDLRYASTKANPVSFALFDLWDTARGRFLDWDELAEVVRAHGLPQVPVLFRGPFAESTFRGLAEGRSTVAGADHVREGVVARPVVERQDATIGRVQLKLVSNEYLERSSR